MLSEISTGYKDKYYVISLTYMKYIETGNVQRQNVD